MGERERKAPHFSLSLGLSHSSHSRLSHRRRSRGLISSLVALYSSSLSPRSLFVLDLVDPPELSLSLAEPDLELRCPLELVVAL